MDTKLNLRTSRGISLSIWLQVNFYPEHLSVLIFDCVLWLFLGPQCMQSVLENRLEILYCN